MRQAALASTPILAAAIDGRREPTNEHDEAHFSEGVGSAFGLLVNQGWSFGATSA